MSRAWGEWYTNEDGNRVKDFPIHRGQAEVLASKARVTAAIAGTGSGKTAVIALFCMQIIQANPKAKIILVSPNYRMLRNSVSKEIRETFAGLQGLKGDWNDTKCEYTCECGAVLHCYSADNDADVMQGVHADALVIDECGLVKSDFFRVGRQRVNKTNGPILLTSTPYKFNWLYYDIYEPWLKGDPDIKVVSFISTDNPSYSKEQFENERKKLPDWRFRMMYLGQFSRPDGLIYPGLSDCVIPRNKLPKIDNPSIYSGFDFGYNDPNVAEMGFVHADCLYLIVERYETQKTIGEFATRLHKGVTYFCDSSRPDSIKELKKLGFKARKAKKYKGSVADNIDKVNELIRTSRIKILDKACPNLVSEANVYTYLADPEKEGEFTDKPIETNNHCMDALAYLVSGLRRQRLLS